MQAILRRDAAMLSVGRCAAAFLLACAMFPAAQAADENPSTRWEKSIAAFEKQDEASPPPRGAALFVGSSSIALWKNLGESFPGVPTINRGFGGSKLPDSTWFTERIILKHQPKLVALYAGENDLAGGASPEQVRDSFQAFVAKVQGSLPETRILFLSVKLSPGRLQLESKVRETNRLIAEFCAKNPKLTFVDLYPLTLDAEGQPRKELFRDALHLNAQGYALWSEKLRPLVKLAP